MLRELAGKLLEAASQLDGSSIPEFCEIRPIYREYHVDGHRAVRILVDVDELPVHSTEQDAEKAVRQFLESIQGGAA